VRSAYNPIHEDQESVSGRIGELAGTGLAGGVKESSDELPEDRTEMTATRTDMAASRTLMAADRTLMAWVRTSLSMSSFGFTIYKVLQGFAEAGVNLPHPQTPRRVGLFLTALGTLAMVMGTVEYTQSLRELQALKDVRFMRPAFVMAILMSLMGLFLFFSIGVQLF
jgi:putative membrane protein